MIKFKTLFPRRKSNIFTFLVFLIYIVINVAFIEFIPPVFSFLNISSTVILLFFFIIINISLAFILKLTAELKKYWSLLKIYQFFIGFFSWLLILGVLYYIKLSIGGYSVAKESNDVQSWYGLGLTFIIVAWEELLFRGVILNYLQKFSTKLNLSFIAGLLFMLIHLLNPEINLFVQGPNLFCAGFLLTFLYLKFKNIWIPIGVHFANNIFYSSIVTLTGYKLESLNIFLTNEGYLDTLFLALTCFIVYRLSSSNN